MATSTAIDLFAGAGGATQGLVEAEFDVLGAVESDPQAAASYRANHPKVELREDDIRSIDADELRHSLGLKRGALTLLKACPPCQAHSSLGKGGPDDPRNDLVDDVWRFVQALRPRMVMLENVPGLARDTRLPALVRRFRGAGYRVRQYIVDATEFGVPQRRRRLIVVAVRSSRRELPESLAVLLPDWFSGSGLRTAGEALRRASSIDPRHDSLHRARRSSKAVLERLRALPVGGTRFDLPERHRLGCHAKLEHRNATASYSRVKIDEPAPTMTTRCTTPACGQFIHPTEHRGLTLREAALIQTFPVNYKFEGGHGQIERQIGNAVPVRMAQGLGLCAVALLASDA